MDFRWTSNGGILLDGNGDIAYASSALETVQDMVRSRLKAALRGWKLYTIGADLQNRVGSILSNELEVGLRRQVQSALTRDFLPAGTFDIRTVTNGNIINIYVYLKESLIATASVDKDSKDSSVVVS